MIGDGKGKEVKWKKISKKLTILVTVSELDTAKALGNSSPKNRVAAVRVAVRKPRDA